MKVDLQNIVSGSYILLDWNVIQYLKLPRKGNKLDENCQQIIESIRRKYHFPYCEAHLRDLARSNNDVYIREDLEFLSKHSRDIVIGLDEDGHILMIKQPPNALYNEIISENHYQPNITPDMSPQFIGYINMKKLDPEHPLLSLLQASGGRISPFVMADWLINQFDEFFNGVEDYKNLRKYLPKLKSQITNSFEGIDGLYKQRLLEHIMPFIDILGENDLKSNPCQWKNVIVHFLQIHGERSPYSLVFETAYIMLDFHPLFREKLKQKKNTLDNIMRDSKMVQYSRSGQYFVTEDQNGKEKANFIYKAFQLKTKAINIEEFVHRFS